MDGRPESTFAADRDCAPGRVLLVEDNPIIALDTEEILLGLGVRQVDVAKTSAAALMFIDAARPQLALLDFNLGEETSEAVARALDDRAIPYVLATGYGDVDEMAEAYRNRAGLLLKPYSKDDLAAALRFAAPDQCG